MKTLVSILLLIVSLSSCTTSTPMTPEKPYVIISKGRHADIEFKPGMIDYLYSSSNGMQVEFIDSISKYSVGDTIR